MLLRVLFLLLLGANAGFFAWRQGWLEPLTSAVGLPGPSEGHEPQRLALQLQPQAIKLLAAPATAAAASAPAEPSAAGGPASAPVGSAATSPGASAAASAASGAADPAVPRSPVVTACLQAGPFSSSERSAVETALRGVQPAVRWEWRDAAPGWWLALGPFPDREAMRAKRDELQRRGLTPEVVSAGPLVLLVLGRHALRSEADAQLAAFSARGVRGARVLAPPGGGETQFLLRVPAADADQQQKLLVLTREQPAARRFASCVGG